MRADRVDSVSPITLGRVLRLARKQAGKTQGDVAAHMLMARTSLVAVENGERKVSTGELVRLARYYGAEVQDLLRASEETEREVDILTLSNQQKHIIHHLLMMKPDRKVVKTLNLVGLERDEIESIASALLHELIGSPMQG